MLSFISPGVKREPWMAVCRGLKHQFRDDPETGFELFNEWSAGDGEEAKYLGEEETRKTWDSYKSAPEGGVRPTTLRAVRWMAQEAGWEALPDAEEAVERLTEAIQAASSLTALTTTLLEGIAREKAFGDVERALLISSVQVRLRALGHRIPLPTLKQEVNRIRQEAAAEASEGEPLQLWLTPWAYVTNMHRMYRISDPNEAVKLDAFDVETRNACRDAGNDPEARPSDIMALSRSFPKAAKQDYNPAKPDEGFYEENGLLVMNTYRDSRPAMDPERAEEAGKILLEHTARNFPDERNQQLLLSSLAFMVRCPGQKIRWAPFIQGVHGCGKTFYAGLMMAVLGQTNTIFVNSGMLHSDFNDWAYGNQLVIFDEILTGSDQKQVMNKVKPFITEDITAINRKGLPAVNAPNRSNCIFLSNFDEGIRIDPGERRYFVLKSAFQTEEGNHPLIAKDLVSSTVLLTKGVLPFGSRGNPMAVGKALARMGFEKLGQVSFHGDKRHVMWVHRAFSDVIDRTPGEVARERYLDSQAAGFSEA
jgi:hypothetical protein